MDLRFPELYRNMQADIISAPSAFTVETGKAHWEILSYAVAPWRIWRMLSRRRNAANTRAAEQHTDTA